MSSEQLADGVNPLDAELAATWDVLKGYSGRDTDLGIARRFGGASAAYSLRDIGAMNGSVVRVRRSPNDTTDAIDDEEKFSANQVQDGTLEKWVNGELEGTLPADVATAAAAYSLRKVNSSYSGDAVRVRRNSDGTEVDVDFDSDDKVSTSSSISVLSGSTTATTLGELITESDVDVGVGGNFFNQNNFTVSGTSATGFTATVAKGNASGADVRAGNQNYINFGKGTVTITYTVTQNTLSGTIHLEVYNFTVSGYGRYDSIGAGVTGTRTVTLTNVDTTGTDGIIRFIVGASAVNDGEVFQVSDISISSTSHTASVHTWYDQAGSNDAVQSTIGNQPKIAESGALLADGLDFDGSNDFLQTSTQVLTGTETGANSMYAVIKQTSGDAGYICGSAGTGGTGSRVGQSLYSSDTDKVVLTDGQDATATGTLDAIDRIEDSNYLISVNYSNNNTNTLHSNSNSNGYANGSSAYAFSAGTKFTIGARDGSTAEAVLFDGSMKEIIAYDSDQSDNRFKIESNINNYYGLYNDANDLSSTSFTVSGGTLSGSNTTDGFTCTTTSSSEVRANFKNPIPSLSSNSFTFHMSFNADLANPAGSSGNGSPIVRLLNSSEAATISAHAVTQGFNSFSNVVNQNAGTDSTILEFFDDDANTSYSISDIRISLIARNGFVETWYDQSGNGEDMTQGTAGNQPSIILNGGQVKDYKGNNSIDFVSGSTRVLDKSSTTTAKTCIIVLDEDSSGSAARAILGFSASTSFMRLDTSTDLEIKAGGVTVNYRAVPTDVTSLYFWYTNGTDEDKLFANNVEEGDTTSNTPPNLPFTRIGARNSDADPYNSRITEVIAFAEDLSADRTVLQDDVNNNYNIF